MAKLDLSTQPFDIKYSAGNNLPIALVFNKGRGDAASLSEVKAALTAEGIVFESDTHNSRSVRTSAVVSSSPTIQITDRGSIKKLAALGVTTATTFLEGKPLETGRGR